jgi:lipopolysaccharide/colanic/teichoic acid biosynthesis glycosyltransferase
VDQVPTELSSLWILPTKTLDEFEVLYQNAVVNPRESQLADSDGIAEPGLHRWQDRTLKPRLLTAAELDASLSHGSTPVRQSGTAAAVPRVHHVDRHHDSHLTQLHDHSFTLPQPGERAKRLLDIIGVLALTLILSPLLVVVGLALAHDRGPIIYRHTRTGRHGRSFGCLKFRTMVPNAEQVLRDLLHKNEELRAEWLRDQKLRDDPRITTIGRFLRRTSLDELPQLWNVLIGEMSLVGPRPVVHEEWARYGRRLHHYLAAKPGVTGLWQVMGRSDCCYRRRVALDSYYVRKRSLILDIFILLQTIKVVLLGRGAC